MNKSILLSTNPEWVAKIFNGIKKTEVRSLFPKDYVGWVYIYCTKGKDILVPSYCGYRVVKHSLHEPLNGKVVARFWCDKVEEIYCYSPDESSVLECATNTLSSKELKEQSCLNWDDLSEYSNDFSKTLLAINITKLEIFDTPKELSEFKQRRNSYGKVDFKAKDYYLYELTKAPQNYCYIEGE